MRHLQQLHASHRLRALPSWSSSSGSASILLSPCPYPCFTACVIFHRSHAHKPRRSVLDGSPHLGPSHDGGKASLTASPYTVHAHMVLIQMASPSWMPSAAASTYRTRSAKPSATQRASTPPAKPGTPRQGCEHAARHQDPQAKGAAPSAAAQTSPAEPSNCEPAHTLTPITQQTAAN